jgi:hypothetical protein
LLALALASSAWAQARFYQTVDRSEVGVEDNVQLTIVATNAPQRARVELPDTRDFEVLSKFQSSQSSFSFGSSGGPQITQTQKYTVVLRPLRTGSLVIPPSVLDTGDGRPLKTEPVHVRVRAGHVDDPTTAPRQRPPPDPFAQLQQQMQRQMQQMTGAGGLDDPFDDQPDDLQVPHSDSDLFVRSTLSPSSVYVGEQATLSIYIYSRVDISSVDGITMPKLDGFWSEDIESPTQLSGEQRVIHGVPYRAYLLRRKALFPVKAGLLTVDAPEADVATGFFFSNRRVHRVGNETTLRVKPLPPGAPKGFSSTSVGEWRLTSDASSAEVELGQPLTVHVTLEGTGNLKNITLPRLAGPGALKIYDPTLTDKVGVSGGRVSGKRVLEYLVVAQQTGTFTLPAVELPYFNPRTQHYETARTAPITFHVVPGQGGTNAVTSGHPAAPETAGVKNVLAAAALHPLRYQAKFERPEPPIWRARFFFPLLFLPLGLWLAVGFAGALKGRTTPEDGSKRLAKEARARLASAHKLAKDGSPEAFYGELERALLGFLESKLKIPVGGLTREGLGARLAEARLPANQQARIRQVLDACDLGRFAQGLATESRDQTLAAAAQVIDRWGKEEGKA